MYFQLGLGQKHIVTSVAINHNIIISERHLRSILKSLNLYRRKNDSDIENVVVFINDTLKESGKMHGYRWMHDKCELNGIKVR